MALVLLLQESLNLFNLDVSMCLVPDAGKHQHTKIWVPS